MRQLTASFLSLLFSVSSLMGQTKWNQILYGAAYYHEYMPYERLDRDIEMMQKAGLNVVRVGESTWSSWEPQDGVFQFEWMERILDRLHQAGIKVILGTPTYSIPPWLYKKHPEIVVAHLGPRPPLGPERNYPTYPSLIPPGWYGPRQNVDLTHPTYRYYAERIIRQIVSRFRDHPAVIGYQIDNETHPVPSYARNMHVDFVRYLRNKFGSVEKLNNIWGLAYWGQLLSDWDEVPPWPGVLNPGYKLEFQRFLRKTVEDFLAWQAAIVREYKRPDQFITHNWPGGLRTDVDQFAIARHLDLVAVNPYYPTQDWFDGIPIHLTGDLARSLKHQNFLVTETNAQTIGWDSRTQFPPYDGQIRLAAYSLISTGANMVAYWHWHSLHYGQETYWKGILSHDLQENRVYREVSKVAHELQRIGPRLVSFQPEAQVAILYSIDSYHGIQFMPFDDHVNYMTILQQLYRTLYRLKVNTDFVFPQTKDLSRYKVIVVPPLYVASDELLYRLVRYVENGGHVLLTFKSGFTNEYSTVRWELAPGPLRKAAGFYYQEFSSLAKPIPLQGDPFKVGEQNRVSVWAEMIIPETAEVLARYDHPFFGRYPAITRNRYGKGTLTYEGTILTDALQEKVVRQVLELAGVIGPDQSLPQPVYVRHGTSNSGKRMHFYLNYSAETQSFTYPYGNGTNVLTGQITSSGEKISLGPWDLAIIEEQ